MYNASNQIVPRKVSMVDSSAVPKSVALTSSVDRVQSSVLLEPLTHQALIDFCRGKSQTRQGKPSDLNFSILLEAMCQLIAESAEVRDRLEVIAIELHQQRVALGVSRRAMSTLEKNS